jgi:hypothetical protein
MFGFSDMEFRASNPHLKIELRGTQFSCIRFRGSHARLDECVGLNASTEERAMMSSWHVTLLALGFRRSNRPARDVDQAIIEG